MARRQSRRPSARRPTQGARGIRKKSVNKKHGKYKITGNETEEEKCQTNYLKFILQSIENVYLPGYPSEIHIFMQFNNELVGSVSTVVKSNLSTDINEEIMFRIPGNRLSDVDELMRIPFLFTAIVNKIGKAFVDNDSKSGQSDASGRRKSAARRQSQRKSKTGGSKRRGSKKSIRRQSKSKKSIRRQSKSKKSIRRQSKKSIRRQSKSKKSIRRKSSKKSIRRKSSKKSIRRRSSKKIRGTSLGKLAKMFASKETRPSFVLGEGNLDILPLMKGEKYQEEIILLESSEKSVQPKTPEEPKKEGSTELKLKPPHLLVTPRLKIKAVNVDNFNEDVPHLANSVMFTIESIQNCEFQDTENNPTFQANVPFLYPNPSKKFENPVIQQHTFYAEGTEDKRSNVRYKKWSSIGPPMFGNPTLSKYRLGDGLYDIKNCVPNCDLKSVINSPSIRLNWNEMRRTYLTDSTEQLFYEAIKRYRVWPIELQMLPSGSIPEMQRIDFKLISKKSMSGKPQGRKSIASGRKSMAKKSISRKSMAKKSISRKSLAKKSISRKSVAKKSRKSVAKKSIARKSVTRKSMSRKSISKKASSAKSDKKFEDKKPTFIAYVDISNLLYPGVTSTRVAAPVLVYQQAEYDQRWIVPVPVKHDEESDKIIDVKSVQLGRKKSLGRKSVARKSAAGRKKSVSRKSVSRKSVSRKSVSRKSVSRKSVSRKSAAGRKKSLSTGKLPTLKKSSADKDKKEDVAMQTDEVPSIPVLTASGKPIFIIVDVSLLKPFIEKMTKKEIDNDIQKIIPDKTIDDKKAAQEKTMKIYQKTIFDLIDYIQAEYRIYVKNNIDSKSRGDYYDDQDFWEHLKESGLFEMVEPQLKELIAQFAVSTVGTVTENAPESDIKAYACTVYDKLIETTNIIINGLDAHTIHKPGILFSNIPSDDNIRLYIADACENLEHKRALNLMKTRIQINEQPTAQWWADYVISARHFKDEEGVVYGLKNIFDIEKYNKEGLLLQAAHMTMSGNVKDAHLFFSSLVENHPRFYPGWVGFHIFYLLMENSEGSNVNFMKGFEAMIDMDSNSEKREEYFLSWSPNYKRDDSLYINAGIEFLKYNLAEFAAICFTQELEKENQNEFQCQYYLAVSHYLLGNYEKSLQHLEKASKIKWEDELVWNLMGHNYYWLGDEENAMRSYIFADNIAKNYNNLGLTYNRMGSYYLKNEKFQEAKDVFKKAAVSQRTPNNWMGLGIALYSLGEFDESEIAFAEANKMDPMYPEVWAYLALINLQKLNYERYTQCISQAKRYGLSDTILINKLEDMRRITLCMNDNLLEGPETFFNTDYIVKAEIPATPIRESCYHYPHIRTPKIAESYWTQQTGFYVSK